MAPEVAFSFASHTVRRNIVLPELAPAEREFEANAADLHAPRIPPRPWPRYREPGEVLPLSRSARDRDSRA